MNFVNLLVEDFLKRYFSSNIIFDVLFQIMNIIKTSHNKIKPLQYVF